MTIFELMGKIVIDGSQANKSIDDTNDNAQGLAKTLNSGVTSAAQSMGGKVTAAVSKVGSTVANAAKVVGKTVIAGAATAATAVTALTKKSVTAYADYEQLVGGVETLFKDSADTVQEYAAVAYKTAGMSANEYMETATSFSASLLQSLGGNTAKAADMANQAIVDMSDNANKMGTDISMIQNAYNGFAKQNYTMLDNLKLGYGGTKAEMERLLSDATALTGVEYDLSSFADITEAIHAVQSEMDITGTTAEEAASTISGSWGSLKGAFNNLLVGFADEDSDLGGLMGNFGDSISTFASNLIPRIGEAFSGIKDSIPELAASLAPALGEVVSGALGLVGIEIEPEQVSNMFGNFFDGVADFFEDNESEFDSIKESLGSIFGKIGAELGEIDWGGAANGLVASLDGILGIVDGFINADTDTAVGKIKGLFGEIALLPINALNLAAEGVENLGAAFKIMEAVDTGSIDISAALSAAATSMETDGKTLTERANSLTQQLTGLLDDIDMGTPSFQAALIAAATTADRILAIFQGKLNEVAADINRVANTISDLATGEKINIGKNNAVVVDTEKEQSEAIQNVNAEYISSGRGLGSGLISVGAVGSSMGTVSNFRSTSIDDPYGVMNMNADGAIFSKATIFGSAAGKLQVAGEAGAEAVAPIDVLQGYVSDAVASQNQGVYEMMAQAIETMRESTESIIAAMENSMGNVTVKVGKREFGRMVSEVG